MSRHIEILFPWAAGFFDGEGSVFFSTSENRNPRIITQVSQVLREPLDVFHDAVSVGSVRGPYDYEKPNHRPYYIWGAENYDALVVYEKIGEFFRSEKKEKFEQCIEQFLNWQQNPICKDGHEKIARKTGDGHYCPTCYSISGKENALKRWKERRD